MLGVVLRQEECGEEFAAGYGGVLEGHQLPPDEDAGAAQIHPALRTGVTENRCQNEQQEGIVNWDGQLGILMRRSGTTIRYLIFIFM